MIDFLGEKRKVKSVKRVVRLSAKGLRNVCRFDSLNSSVTWFVMLGGKEKAILCQLNRVSMSIDGSTRLCVLCCGWLSDYRTVSFQTFKIFCYIENVLSSNCCHSFIFLFAFSNAAYGVSAALLSTRISIFQMSINIMCRSQNNLYYLKKIKTRN